MASQTVTAIQTYDLTTGIMVDIENMIHMLSPFDVPLLGQYTVDGSGVLSTDTCFEKKVEWLDEALLTPRSLVSTTITGGQTLLTLTLGEANRFQTNDLVRVNNEVLYLTSMVDSSSYTVIRAWGNTTAQTLTAAAIVVGVGSANAEGADPQNARWLDRGNRYNYTEIFGPYKVEVTASENAIRKYGITGTEFDHQVLNRSRESWIAQEQAVLYGARNEVGDPDATADSRSMGGIFEYITTNVDSTTTVLTEAALVTQLSTAFDAGGNPDRIVVGSKQKGIISQFTFRGSGGQLIIDRKDAERGTVVDAYFNDFGRQFIVLDRWVRPTDLFLFEGDQATVCTLRPMSFQMLSKTGDAEKGMVVAEKTLRFRMESHAAKFTALT